MRIWGSSMGIPLFREEINIINFASFKSNEWSIAFRFFGMREENQWFIEWLHYIIQVSLLVIIDIWSRSVNIFLASILVWLPVNPNSKGTYYIICTWKLKKKNPDSFWCFIRPLWLLFWIKTMDYFFYCSLNCVH